MTQKRVKKTKTKTRKRISSLKRNQNKKRRSIALSPLEFKSRKFNRNYTELSKTLEQLQSRLGNVEDRLEQLIRDTPSLSKLSRQYDEIHHLCFESYRDTRFQHLQSLMGKGKLFIQLTRLEELVAAEFSFDRKLFERVKHLDKGRPSEQATRALIGTRICFYLLHKVFRLDIFDIQYLYKIKTHQCIIKQIQQIDFYLRHHDQARSKTAQVLRKLSEPSRWNNTV